MRCAIPFRQLLAPLLAAVLLAGLTGCGGSPAAEVPSAESSVAARTDERPAQEVTWPLPDGAIERIDALLEEMTLDEKIGQLTLFTSHWDVTGPTLRDDTVENIRAGKVGAIFNAFTAEYTRELQRMAVEETRLGIPLLFGYDVIHGHRTIFPLPIGESASWDMAAIERSARVAATEAAAEGIHWTFAPMVDVARDPRWGRVSEGSGEDVFLTSEIAKARVRGFQGEDPSAIDTVLATVKHFAAYGAAQAGRDYHTTNMSDRALRETYLPPFKAAIDAGAASVMTAFNEINGVPATGNKYLLTNILRDEWGFDGFVVTDYTSINEMVPHGFSGDLAQAGEQALNAGVDMDMQGAVFMEHLAASVEDGRVDEADIDRAVRRILAMKAHLGLFDDPYRYSDVARQEATIYAEAHLEAARDMARRSMVLLKNEDSLLPLPDDLDTIALIGPLVDSKADMIGSWAAAGDREEKPVTVREALETRFGDTTEILYAAGADMTFGAESDPAMIDAAVAAAEAADVVIVTVGEPWEYTGEAASRTDLQLPGAQNALLEALERTGKPIVMVLMTGRPLTVTWADENLESILLAWYPGTMGGHAVADVLFGDYNPAGKLPITFPRNVGQVPIHYDMKNTGRPFSEDQRDQKYLSRYLNTPNTPLYPFGYGLSYTTFEYSPVTLSEDKITIGDTVTASVTVTNTGKRTGEEVVQLYVRDRVGSVTRPVKQLKGFRKVMLEPGRSEDIRFTLSMEDLAFIRADGTLGTEPGAFDIFVGPSSDIPPSASFDLTDENAANAPAATTGGDL